MSSAAHERVWAAARGQGRDWIAARIPHQGRMSLLGDVIDASNEGIICRADSHRASDHPLRQHDRLGAACGIEYAAQAMALHGSLLAEQRGAARAQAGFLINVRGVALHADRLDDVAHELHVAVQCLADNGDHCSYGFQVSSAGRALVEGRALVMLDVKVANA